MLLDILLVGRNFDGLFDKIEYENGGWLSVQASENHNCSPQQTFDESDQYWEFEVAADGINLEEWKEFEREPGMYHNVPRYAIEQMIMRYPLKHYYQQELVNDYCNIPHEVYCEECDFTVDETKPFHELRKLIVSMEGAYVSDGEGGNISICPKCKSDALVIYRS